MERTRMPLVILLLLIGLPLLEISVFIEVGGKIGAFWTVAATLGTAALGVTIVRLQGMVVMARARQNMMRGEPLVGEMIHGMFLFLAGVLLLIPGFLTDALGALFLLPPVRSYLGRVGMAGVILGHPKPPARRDAAGNVIIEGQFQIHDDPENDNDDDGPAQPPRE
jgi:UPF0716 protein FxsA